MTKNVSYTGGFLAALASLAARAIPLEARVLPTTMPGLATGLLSGGIHKAISGSDVGDGLYLHKHDKCYRVQKLKGNGLYLAPHPRFVEGDDNMAMISVMVLVCSLLLARVLVLKNYNRKVILLYIPLV